MVVAQSAKRFVLPCLAHAPFKLHALVSENWDPVQSLNFMLLRYTRALP